MIGLDNVEYREVRDIHKSLTYAGFVTSKQFNQNEWTFFIATGSEPGAKTNMTLMGFLRATTSVIDYDVDFAEDSVYMLFLKKVAPDEFFFRGSWKNACISHGQTLGLFDYKSKAAESKTVFNDVQNLRRDLQYYRKYVEFPSSLARKKEANQNRNVLPFYLAGDDPDMCSAALRLNLAAISPVATALRLGLITFDEAEEYAGMPDEWSAALLFKS